MNIFKPTLLTWRQLGILKWSVFFIGIAVGATWPEVFARYATLLFVVGLVLGAYLAVIWLRRK